MIIKFKELEDIIKYKFNSKNILKKCLTHKSYDESTNNEKLEFLGDRVLGLVISKNLLFKYPNEKEGIIDKKFSNLVNKTTCSKIAKKLDLKKYLILGDSYKDNGKADLKILSDALEALIGAIFLDQGIITSEKFIINYWKDFIKKSNYTEIDSKTKLQEYSLKKFKKLPKYKLFKQSGPKHNPIFKVEVQIPNSNKFVAIGNSKKNAEQKAAKKLLTELKI